MIVTLSDWAVQTACDQLQAWQKASLSDVAVAVNLSAKHFQQEDVDKQIIDAVSQRGLRHSTLEIELTESALMRDAANTAMTLKRLKEAGFNIAVDDFGTGYSSLSYLQKFPINALKIDRSFVSEIDAVMDSRSICKAIIALAHGLGMKVIAEGVETAGQLEYLQSLGCEEVQGYLIAKPMSATVITEFLNNRRDNVVGTLPVARST